MDLLEHIINIKTTEICSTHDILADTLIWPLTCWAKPCTQIEVNGFSIKTILPLFEKLLNSLGAFIYEDWLTSKDGYCQGWNKLFLHQYCLEREQQIIPAQMKPLLLSGGVWACRARGLQVAGYICRTPMQQLLPLLGNDYAIPFAERRAAQRMRESRTRQITENLGMFWMTTDFIITADGIVWGSH